MKIHWTRLTVIISGMIGLSTLSFNCAPSVFESADYSYLRRDLGSSVDLFAAITDSPYALLNTFQVFSTMANVTGQDMVITNTQRAEYDGRTGAMSQTDKLTDLNAPMQMAATSLAGEFCSGLISRESASGASRLYFQGVNFGANLSANTPNAYAASVGAMARGFWGRDIRSDEYVTLTAYYNDFVATAGTQTAQTRNLYLSTCAAMLASLDAMTY